MPLPLVDSRDEVRKLRTKIVDRPQVQRMDFFLPPEGTETYRFFWHRGQVILILPSITLHVFDLPSIFLPPPTAGNTWFRKQYVE